MRQLVFAAAIAFCLCGGESFAQTASKQLFTGAAIHDPAGAGTVIDSTDFYGSGNDDNFSEYGVASFVFGVADFGGGPVDQIQSFQLDLTHNDRGFSDGTEFELYLTTDDLSGSAFAGLGYDTSLVNGLDTSQYTNISSLGVFSYTPEAGGTVDSLDISLTGSQTTDILAEIAAASEFSIIITATASDADVTFTGFDDSFENGGQPVLTIAVPEPSSVAVIALAGLAGLVRRKR